MVVNKPAGLVVHPGCGNYHGTLVNAIAWHLKDNHKYEMCIRDSHSAMDGMPELFPDHIHPNEEGAKVMAKAVYDAIAQ